MIGPTSPDDQHIADIISTVLDPAGKGASPGGFADQQPMSDSTLRALIAQKMQSSHQWYGSGKLASQRMDADKYYRGDPLGNEVDGRSQVVSRDVAEAVDSMIPSFMRIFAAGEEVVKMDATTPEAEEAAKQATDYLNWLFLQKNEGFQILYTWFKDALLKKNGIVKCWFETRISRKKDNYENLTEQEFAVLKTDPTKQMFHVEQSQMPVQVLDPVTMAPTVQQVPVYNCTVMSATPVKKICVANVPPDEFVIERRAASLETANFMAHKCKRTASDLIELGFDPAMVKGLPRGDDENYTQERIERFKDEDQLPYGVEGDSLDWTMKPIWVVEAYLKVDYDGDGIAEWRQVMLAGGGDLVGADILSNTEVDDHPFAALTPIIQPHKFYGWSMFDQVKDIQEIKTVLLRGSLDSVYLGNAPRMGIVEGQVNIDDLLDVRPGGLVRLKNANALVPIQTAMVAPQAFEMIEYIDGVKQNRTGVTPFSQGLDPDTLNKTATGANLASNASQQHTELMARVFAETGVKRLFRRLFELTCLHQNEAQMVRLRGKWVNIDPRSWQDKMDVTVSVGIGLGDKQQQLNSVMMALNLDEKIVQMQGGLTGPLVTGENVYNKLAKLVEALGWKTPEPFYTDPKTLPPQPPKPPSPEVQKDQVALQMKQIDLDMKNIDLEIKRLEAQALGVSVLQQQGMNGGFGQTQAGTQQTVA